MNGIKKILLAGGTVVVFGITGTVYEFPRLRTEINNYHARQFEYRVKAVNENTLTHRKMFCEKWIGNQEIYEAVRKKLILSGIELIRYKESIKNSKMISDTLKERIKKEVDKKVDEIELELRYQFC